MPRPLARLPIPEPTPAPVDPLAAHRRQVIRASADRYARLLLRLSAVMPVPPEAVAPLAALTAVVEDQTRRINDEINALTDAWPELSEAAQPHLGSLHRVTDGVGVAARCLGISRSALWLRATRGDLPIEAYRVMPNEEIRYSTAWLDQESARCQPRTIQAI